MWRDGLWLKLWDMGVKGRMWCVIKKMYEASRSTVLLEGEKSAMFSVEQGAAQGCSLSPIFNLQRACAARVTVLGLCVCLSVCVTTFSAATRNETAKKRYQRVQCHTGFILKMAILIKMLRSKVMA